jgi:hypothetical protein
MAGGVAAAVSLRLAVCNRRQCGAAGGVAGGGTKAGATAGGTVRPAVVSSADNGHLSGDIARSESGRQGRRVGAHALLGLPAAVEVTRGR